MEAIFKTFRAEVKGVNADEGTIDMLIPVSTASVDRDGEVVEPTAFKKTLPKFMKRPVLVASHDYRALTSQIGEWTKLKITEDGIEGKPKYYVNEGNEQADWGFKLASKGMAAFSIGFIPKIWEDGTTEKEPRRTYKEVELLEISQVIVPSNREAIQSIRSKSVDPIINEICDAVEKEIEPEGEPEIVESYELITKPEETDEFIRIPVRDCKVTATIDISKKEGISALYCGKEKQVRTYLFRKDHGWTMAKAKAWVKEHEGKEFDLNNTEGIEIEHPKPAEVSQHQICDELDYLIRLIDTEGMNEDVKKDFWRLVEEGLRLAGNDIPDNIRALLKPDVSKVIETKETFTIQDIQEAIKRIAKNLMEV